jgi:signal transduction histidine kinase
MEYDAIGPHHTSANENHVMRCFVAVQIACAALILSMIGMSPAAAVTRQVVLLFDERVELPGLSAIDAEIVHTLRSSLSGPIEVYREPMDLSRFGSASYKAALRDFLTAKYAEKGIDAVVAVMAPALDFLLDFGGTIFPGTPIVFCGLDRAQLGGRALPANVHGVLVKRDFAPTLELALRLHPGADRAVVVSGTSDFDVSLMVQAKEQFRAFEERISLAYLSNLPLKEVLAKVSASPDRTIVLFTSLFRDGAGQHFVPHEAVERLSAAASAPVYGFVDQFLGRGIVGGSLYSFAEHGTETARLVLRLIAGTAPAPMLLEIPSNEVMLDWRQLQRWGVSDSDIPAGARVYFREPRVWETYRWQLSLIFAVILIEAALIFGLLYEHRRRNIAEVQARQRMAELAHINRYSMAGELTSSIAHEISQPLGSILANAETMELMLKSPLSDMKEIREIVSDIRRDDERASEVIRRLRSLLKKVPFELRTVDLNEVVGETIGFCSGIAVARGVDLSNALAPASLRIKGDRIQLQQVILNLVVNAMDAMAGLPAAARKVTVLTACIDKTAEVSVTDSGSGVPPDKLKDIFEPFVTTKAQGMGMGLSIARTIVEAHRGRIWAESEAGRGAIFRIRLPLA